MAEHAHDKLCLPRAVPGRGGGTQVSPRSLLALEPGKPGPPRGVQPGIKYSGQMSLKALLCFDGLTRPREFAPISCPHLVMTVLERILGDMRIFRLLNRRLLFSDTRTRGSGLVRGWNQL